MTQSFLLYSHDTRAITGALDSLLIRSRVRQWVTSRCATRRTAHVAAPRIFEERLSVGDIRLIPVCEFPGRLRGGSGVPSK